MVPILSPLPFPSFPPSLSVTSLFSPLPSSGSFSLSLLLSWRGSGCLQLGVPSSKVSGLARRISGARCHGDPEAGRGSFGCLAGRVGRAVLRGEAGLVPPNPLRAPLTARGSSTGVLPMNVGFWLDALQTSPLKSHLVRASGTGGWIACAQILPASFWGLLEAGEGGGK